MKRLLFAALAFALAALSLVVQPTPMQQSLLAMGASGPDLSYVWTTTNWNVGGCSGPTAAAITTFGTNGGRITWGTGNAPCANFQRARTASALSGKVYAEFKFNRSGGTWSGVRSICFGVAEDPPSGNLDCVTSSGYHRVELRNGTGSGCGASAGYMQNDTFTADSTYAHTNNDIISLAADASTRQVWVRKNGGAWLSGDPAAGTSPTATAGGTGSLYFGVAIYCDLGSGTENGNTLDIMPDTGSQTYAVPSGFTAYKP